MKRWTQQGATWRRCDGFTVSPSDRVGWAVIDRPEGFPEGLAYELLRIASRRMGGGEIIPLPQFRPGKVLDIAGDVDTWRGILDGFLLLPVPLPVVREFVGTSTLLTELRRDGWVFLHVEPCGSAVLPHAGPTTHWVVLAERSELIIPTPED